MMEEEVTYYDLTAVKQVLAVCSVFFLIFTFQCFTLGLGYFSLVFGLWIIAAGIGAGYLVFSYFPALPCVFFLTQQSQVKSLQSQGNHQVPITSKCSICGNPKCQRHRPEISKIIVQPWDGLSIPQSVDQALEQFLDLVLENFVYGWYREVSSDECCVDELRTSIRYIASIILRRIRKIDVPAVVINEFAKEGLRHLSCYQKVKQSGKHEEDIQRVFLEALGPRKHCALYSRPAELHYLRKISETVLPIVLPPNSLQCRSLIVLLQELLASAVLLGAMDKLSEPDFVNQMLLVLLDEEPMVASNDPPTPRVSFLSQFAKPRVPFRNSALHLSMADILHSQSALFPFMQFMKGEAALNVLQFCLSVEDFNKRVFAPKMTVEEKSTVTREAKDIYRTYFDVTAIDRINFDPDIVEGLKTRPLDRNRRLRMASLLSRAYEHAYNLLENTFLPLFYQSDDYFALLCGSRLPARSLSRPALRASKKRFEPLSDLSKLASKIKDKVLNPIKGEETPPYEEDPFDPVETPPDFELESDDEDGHGRDASEVSLRDMSTWSIAIPHLIMESKQTGIYIISVQRPDIAEGSRWDAARRYNEFFVLHSKLEEFHDGYNSSKIFLCYQDLALTKKGRDKTFLQDTSKNTWAIDDSYLPPKRTSVKVSTKKPQVFFENCRIQFEKYLQSLASNPLVKGSALLFNFLSPEKECQNMFGPDTMGDIAGKKFKSMIPKLTKEKGQNLEPFLQSFLSSTVESTRKKSPARPPDDSYTLRRKSSSGIPRLKSSTSDDSQEESGSVVKLNGVYEYVQYLAEYLFRVPGWLIHLLACVQVIAQKTFDAFVFRYLSGKVELLKDEQRLVMIIHLLRDALFFDQEPPRTDTQKLERREETLKQMMHFIPDPAVKLVGSDRHCSGMSLIFEVLQHPKLNKQLAYSLLDILLCKLFPEVKRMEISPSS